MISPGDSCPLSQSYCRKTIEQGRLWAVQNAPEEGWKEDPAYEAFGLGSYVGSEIRVGGDIYGTFCFAAEDARPEQFTEREKTFVELLTLWASYEIGRNRATRRLKAQNERLDRFASVVSHDLRNPLNVAKGRLQLARESLAENADSEHDGPAPTSPDSTSEAEKDSGAEEEPSSNGSSNSFGESSDGSSDENPRKASGLAEATGPAEASGLAEATGHMEAAEGALGRMDNIIEDMLVLTWGRREAGSEETEPVSLEEAAERCWAHVSAPEASLSAGSAGKVVAHEGRLHQLLENLFRNAIEHGAEDTRVTVGILPSDESSQEGATQGFFIEDDGPGIPEEKREEVLETGYSTTETGTGLGLSIVQAVTSSHGWDLSVTEGSEGGARFEISGAEIFEN